MNYSRLPLTPSQSTSPTSSSCPIQNETDPSESLSDYPQEITWLFFRDNKWIPFQSNNHYKIEQAFTLGGIYVDIKGTIIIVI
ncbi:uncharacterized protein B0P05DRAFT_589213 [Gilbertella persicaria]|uniref:uncharacterized protein n=1 Tax=Gilbertella persicaria TaxID=101096 RepID=UPI00221FAB84|nr:uncharacterized protein B0P05DRAFT_589213 [Gilbertella persicaria]KAI8069756.1 hypothetical protein B0P05DRAFT_589213 [Gilbertella persicaria]